MSSYPRISAKHDIKKFDTSYMNTFQVKSHRMIFQTMKDATHYYGSILLLSCG